MLTSITSKYFPEKYNLKQKSDLYLEHYEEIMTKYISDGNPSTDTLNNYFSRIRNFLSWCHSNYIYPLSCQEEHIILYRDTLIKNKFKMSSVSAHLIAIKKFFYVAAKFHLIYENPAIDVKAPRDPDANLVNIPYLTAGKLEYLFQVIPGITEKELRDKVIIAYMAIEGLRTIEVHRMNEEDINKEQSTILIRGKGKNSLLYPRKDTFALLLKYLQVKDRTNIEKNGQGLTPIFTSTSNNRTGKRISRQAIRDLVDKWLLTANCKEKGKSAHMLRHTCATLLYKETKDIRAVQETLRHSSINISSQYAHLTEREEQRYTNSIPVEIE